MRESIVKGHEIYKIYEDGTVINIKKNLKLKWQKTGAKEYHGVYLNGVSYGIHKLLAIHFIPNPNNHKIVRFKDGDIDNLSLDNLFWCNYSRGEVFDGVTLHAYDKYDNSFIKEYNHLYEVIDDGFEIESVKRCLRGKLKSHGGMRWIRKY